MPLLSPATRTRIGVGPVTRHARGQESRVFAEHEELPRTIGQLLYSAGDPTEGPPAWSKGV